MSKFKVYRLTSNFFVAGIFAWIANFEIMIATNNETISMLEFDFTGHYLREGEIITILFTFEEFDCIIAWVEKIEFQKSNLELCGKVAF